MSKEQNRIEVDCNKNQLNLQADTPMAAIAQIATKNIANTLKFIFHDKEF